MVCNHRRFKVYFRGYPWARELARLGHEVDLYCHADTARLHTQIETVDGFRIIQSPDLLVGALRQGWDPYCAARRAAFMFREGKPYDLIHCLDTRPAVIWPALAYARAHDIPIVSDWIDWWGRGGLITERRPLWYQTMFGGVETWFEEHYRARLDGLTAISHALMNRGIALGCDPDRCIVINGAADMATFASPLSKEEARTRLHLPADDPVVCFSGLDVLVDLPLAVQAYEHIRQRVPAARLLLVGPEAADARAAVTSQETLRGIVAIGKIPYSDLPKTLPAADLFLLPYPDRIVNVGRWPNKIGDYMAVGRPTVANPVGELNNLFGRFDIGVLSDATPGAMAEAAVALLCDPVRRDVLGRNARGVAASYLSWSTQIAKLETWYRVIIARSTARSETRLFVD